MNIIIDQVRREASDLLDSQRRSDLGQYMTPHPIAAFMASLFSYNSQARLLDAGAGIGSLTSAFFDQALQNGTTVDAEAWEIDSVLGGYLKNTLDEYVQHEHGKIKVHIHESDFIEDAVFYIQFDSGNRYTHAILNPPYKKIGTNSKHRKLLRMAGIETVNLYTAFVALAVLLMKKGGEIVAIIPRSFCNGSYYRPFRNLILRTCSIRQLHLFESRNKAFQDDEILQENVIIHLVKGEPQGSVIVSTSHDAKFLDYRQTPFDAGLIVKPGDMEQFIHIPTAPGQTGIPELCTHTLCDIGLEVCTGPVVDFRLKEYWRDEPTEGTAPLIYPHHFSNGALCWPKSHKKPNALQSSPDIGKWLMPRGHYVLVKRFTAKEERRRLVAYHLPHEALNAAYIGFENHWNVFHTGKHGMDESTARGLATFLNSTVLDDHFRAFSGHTQVNATDLRNMHYPSREQLQKLGQRAKNQPADQAGIDRLIEEMEADYPDLPFTWLGLAAGDEVTLLPRKENSLQAAQ
jgi:adenine-specific DNA-methyltransferase